MIGDVLPRWKLLQMDLICLCGSSKTSARSMVEVKVICKDAGLPYLKSAVVILMCEPRPVLSICQVIAVLIFFLNSYQAGSLVAWLITLSILCFEVCYCVYVC